MNKAVLISIRPEWCQKIINGEKTIEIRKNKPKLELPFKCYIYCTDGRTLYRNDRREIRLAHKKYTHMPDHLTIMSKSVIAEFICDRILPIEVQANGSIRDWNHFHLENSCVPYENVAGYIGNGKTGRGWCISDLKIYAEPLSIDHFRKADFNCKRNGVDPKVCHSCYGCWDCEIKRPPQSWCYVEER